MVIIAKLMVWACTSIWIAWLIETARLGRKWTVQHRYGSRHFKGRPDQHRRAALMCYGFLWMTILTATLAHIAVRHQIGMQAVDTVFMIHLPCALILVILMPVMIFWKNGMRDPHRHKQLAVAVLLLSGVVLVTGCMLVGNL